MESPISPENADICADEGASRSAAATRARLLDAAECLFADRGYQGTSIRALAEQAGASVSAAHYHFGSKQALLRAVLERRIEPINALRVDRLCELEAAADGGPVELEDVLDAFVRPSVEAWQASKGSLERTGHIVAQLHVDAHDSMRALRAELFGPTMHRFLTALGRALPGRTREALALDLHLVLGQLVHVVGGHLALAGEADESALPMECEVLIRRLIDFSAAGMRAKPLTSKLSREEIL